MSFNRYCFFNRHFFRDYYLALETRTEAFKNQLFKKSFGKPADQKLHGYFGYTELLADTTILEKEKTERLEKAARKIANGRSVFQLRYPRKYVESIAALAAENGTELHFLYLPGFGWPTKLPLEAIYYKRYGDIWVPPDSVFSKHKHWFDDGHFNGFGANAMLPWLQDQIEETLDVK